MYDSDKPTIPIPTGPTGEDAGSGRPAEMTADSRVLETAITAACHVIADMAAELDAGDRLCVPLSLSLSLSQSVTHSVCVCARVRVCARRRACASARAGDLGYFP